MTRLSKHEVLRVIRRAGMPETALRLEPLLPDTVDLDREGELLERFGVSREDLIDRMGGSP